jgi:hypothetical protein
VSGGAVRDVATGDLTAPLGPTTCRARPREEGGTRALCYRLCAAQLREVSDWLRKYERFWGEKLDALGEHLDEAP